MPISIVRLGTRRRKGEGLRIGTVRRPPRGVLKSQYAREDWFDVWLPNLAPSASLMRASTIGADGSGWTRFARRFRAELKQPDQVHLLDVLAALSHSTKLAIGCYCADESRCHRSILRRELASRGAALKP
jgi:uncharacterized protein YeaO (DUF488 family)